MTMLAAEGTARDGMMTAGEQLKRLVIDILLIEDEEYVDANGPDEIATWDSLATVNLASAIEKSLGVRVPSDDMAAFNCIGDIKDFCRAQGLDV
jgi:acyl carrier protein